MIATLTISLPTAGAGGELIVRHRGREATLDMNADEPSELAFAAFYADCSHESRPVRRGHRLSLVFNLCLRPGDAETPRRAPDYSDQVEGVTRFLVQLAEERSSARKIRLGPGARLQRSRTLLRGVEKYRCGGGAGSVGVGGPRRVRVVYGDRTCQ